MAEMRSRTVWIALALALAAAAIAVLLCMRGRGKAQTPAPAYDRTADAAYQQELEGIIKDRNGLVKARRQTVSGMEAVIAKAREALPAGATDADVKAELDGHPEKYPEWKDLNEKIAKDNAAIEDSLKDAQSRVRARLMKELGPLAKPHKKAPPRVETKE